MTKWITIYVSLTCKHRRLNWRTSDFWRKLFYDKGQIGDKPLPTRLYPRLSCENMNRL